MMASLAATACCRPLKCSAATILKARSSCHLEQSEKKRITSQIVKYYTHMVLKSIVSVTYAL